MGHALDGLDFLQRVEQKSPGGRLSATRVSHHHHAVVNILNLVQLQDLGHPGVGDDKMALGREAANGLLQCLKVCRHVLDAREALPLDGRHDLDIRLDELGGDGLPDALHNNFRFNYVFCVANAPIGEASTLETARADQDAFQGAETKVVVCLLRELAGTLVKKGHRLLRELFGLVETLRVEHDFGNELLVRLRHGHAAKELLQVVGQVGAARVARVHGDEDAGVFVHAQLAAHQLNLRLAVLCALLKAELNVLNLLRDGRQDPFLEAVKLVETAPSTNLADSEENAAHGLKVECVVAAKDEGESAELNAQSLDRLRLAGSGRSVWRASEALAQGLREGEEASVGEGGSDETFRNAQILEAVVELGIGHPDL
ncbi:hypothetical protein G6O67_000939 [Ophiocordyceps sinensis]|uniref:Uncharacterized protein n=1 Tax=Ophiocordyceps sinensis TaxID=72228 RepID=A0A8H4Q097_9HYPO|nr:hypothetical protein G6O67_000939 [Ophiocordyceps sinensis]